MFAGVYPSLDALNIMRLASPESAILSAVIFNALVIIALIPLALRGVRYRPASRVASCSAATCWSTASAASSCRSSASSSSTCSSSSSRGSRDAPTHLARPAPRRAARRCSSSPCCSAWPTRWPWSRVGQLPGLDDKADGSLIAVGRHDRRQRADRPVLHRRRRQPGPAVLPVPPVGRRRRLRPDLHRRPATSARRASWTPSPPTRQESTREPAHPGLRAQQGGRRARRRRRRPPVLHRRRGRRGARGVPRRRPDRPGHPGGQRQPGRPGHPVRRHLPGGDGGAAPSPARTTWPPAGWSPRSGATRPPTRPCPPTRSPPAAAASTRTSARRTPSCR